MDYSFFLYGYKLRDRPTYEAAIFALGLNATELDHAKRYDIALHITCTDAQFGNFIAQRVLRGCRSNGIIELDVKVIGSRCNPPIPVVFNPNFDVR